MLKSKKNIFKNYKIEVLFVTCFFDAPIYELNLQLQINSSGQLLSYEFGIWIGTVIIYTTHIILYTYLSMFFMIQLYAL